MTNGISVMVSGNGLSPVTVQQVIELLGSRCASLVWRIDYAEVNGHDVGPDGQARIDALAHTGQGISSQQLLDCLRAIGQLVEGEFSGHDTTGSQAIRITMVDGASVDVESSEDEVLRLIEASYPRTTRFSY